MMYTFLRNLTVALMIIALGEATALALGTAAGDAATRLAGLL